MADYARDPRAYELMAIFVPELSDEELVEQIERVTGYITDQSGTITEVLRESPWGRRRLAYTVRFNSVDFRDGIYVVYHFDSIPSVVTEIERELKLDVRVMRYLLVHDDPLAGEKDTGQTVEGAEGEAVAGEGEAAAATPAVDATTETAPDAAADVATTETSIEPEVAPDAPVAEDAPAEAETPAEEVAPAEDVAPAEEAAPAEDVAPAEEKTPAEADVASDTASEEVPATKEESKED